MPSYLCSLLHSDIFRYLLWMEICTSLILLITSLLQPFFWFIPVAATRNMCPSSFLQHRMGYTHLHLRSPPCGTLFSLSCYCPVYIATWIKNTVKSIYSYQEGLPNVSFLFNKHKTTTKKGSFPNVQFTNYCWFCKGTMMYCPCRLHICSWLANDHGAPCADHGAGRDVFGCDSQQFWLKSNC